MSNTAHTMRPRRMPCMNARRPALLSVRPAVPPMARATARAEPSEVRAFVMSACESPRARVRVVSSERYPDTRRLPTTATPIAVATCLVALKVPDAIPACSRGTAPITASVVGARVNPNPAPTVNVATRMMPNPESSLAIARTTSPIAKIASAERDRAFGADALGEPRARAVPPP